MKDELLEIYPGKKVKENMPLTYHPEIGTIVVCNFDGIQPEMVKRRPAVVISPRFRYRDNLCTVVPLSTTPPNPEMSYHCRIELDEPLPPPYDASVQWVKADMLATVSFQRLYLPYHRKDGHGKRQYITKIVSDTDLHNIRECILCALGLSDLTQFL